MRNNVFKDHIGIPIENIQKSLDIITNYTSLRYFAYSNAPIIQIQYEKEYQLNSMFEGQVEVKELNQLHSNLFMDNSHHQVILIENTEYEGSLLQFTCDNQLTELEIIDNLIIRNKFIGPHTHLFYMTGGIMTIRDNIAEYNGELNFDVKENTPSRVNTTGYFPYQAYYYADV